MPTVPPGALLLAVVSAGLLALLVIRAIRSRAIGIETPLCSALAGEEALIGRELFSSVLLERPFSGLGLALSTLVHLVVLLGTPLLPYLFYDRLQLDLRKFDVKIVTFQLPGPLYYAARAKQRREVASRPPRPPQTGAVRRVAVKPSPQIQPASQRPRFELPVSARTRSKDIVILPDLPPDISMELIQPLPTAFLWAQGPAPLEVSRVVGAPPTPPLPVFTLPRSTPAIQRPNREVPIADLQIGTAPALTFRPPQLPVPAANVSPVRMPPRVIETPPGELPASALPAGSPMNLIAIMSMPAPLAPVYLLEAGNLLAPSDGGPSAPGASGQPEKSAAVAENKAPGNESGLKELLKESSSPTNQTLSTGPSGTLTLDDKGNSASASATTAATTTPARLPSIEPVRGNLGIIIVRPSLQEASIDAGEVLSGQPVYTMYIDVPGSLRRWELHYCIPASASPSFVREGDSVIRILPRKSLDPPFPLDRIPVDIAGYTGKVPRLIVYALVNERGETENVRLVRGTGQEIDARAVAILKKWSFRPARRGDSPVAVEALFGIPLN